jgi:hypothetical protein
MQEKYEKIMVVTGEGLEDVFGAKIFGGGLTYPSV